MELILHRGGNGRIDAAAIAVADLVEIDVHSHRGRLEVRHEKVLWPTGRLWERWRLLPRRAPRRELHQVLADVDGQLLVDLKGVRPRTAQRVLAALGERRPLVVSTKSWWMLQVFRSAGDVRTFRSVGNRAELAALLHLPSRVRPHGIVAHHRLLSADVVAVLQQRAEAVWAWGAQDGATIDRLRSWGVSGLIVDDVELIRELRHGRAPN